MNQTMTWTGIAAETWDASGGDEPLLQTAKMGRWFVNNF